jgi:hypothetical protein
MTIVGGAQASPTDQQGMFARATWLSDSTRADAITMVRHAKNLINAAENLPRPHDSNLAADLDLWIRLKPRLT